MSPEFRREHRRLSPAERERYARLAQQVEQEFPANSPQPDRSASMVATLGDYYELRMVVADLREARESRNFSLSDIGEMTGIDPERIRRIEDGTSFDLVALSHYAHAVGKRIRIGLSDIPEPADATKR